MLRSITAEQLFNWVAYYELEPFGERVADYRSAQIVQALYNIARDTKKQREPFELEDFLLPFGDSAESRVPKKRDFRELKATMQLWAMTQTN